MLPELEQDVFEAERSSSNTKWISAPVKRQNETRNRSLISKNAFPPRETDQNFRKTPSRGGKWGKFSEKRLPAAGNGKNSQKNGFPRRESDKISRKTVSCGGKAVKFAGDRFPAAGKGGKISKNAFPPREEGNLRLWFPAAGRMRPHRRPSSNFAGGRRRPRVPTPTAAQKAYFCPRDDTYYIDHRRTTVREKQLRRAGGAIAVRSSCLYGHGARVGR